MKKIKIIIGGMHCASCSSNVERSLKKVEGVKEVAVSLMTGKAILQVEDSVSKEELRKAVLRAGYKPGEITE